MMMIRVHVVLLAIVALVGLQAQVGAVNVDLGSAQSFGVLAGSTVTNTGSSVINGDVGVSPGTAITGFYTPGIVNGTIHSNDAAAQQAQIDALAAYNSVWGMAATQNLSGQDLGGMTLTPGVYWFNSSAGLTGNLTLNAQGNSNALFIFHIGSTLTTAPNSSVTWTNNYSSGDLYFGVGSSATLDTGTDFWGTILADQSISMNAGANITGGRALALNGAVTLIDNDITTNNATPELSTWALLGCTGLFGVGMLRRRRKA